jgi:GNAT superfamily N-acetyltransferase
MSVHIRFAKPEDVPQILDLIRELAEYEKEPQEVTITEEEMVKDGFEDNLYKCLVAEKENQILGIALYYPRYSTWKGRTIHLEDFIVKEEARGGGVGMQLFERVIFESNKFGAKRLEWMVLEWNEPAIKFYKKIGAELDSEWHVGKLRESQIQNYSFTTL